MSWRSRCVAKPDYTGTPGLPGGSMTVRQRPGTAIVRFFNGTSASGSRWPRPAGTEGFVGIDKLVFLFLVVLIVGFLLVRPTIMPAMLPVVIVLAPILCIIAFTNFNFALLLLILFMLLSPEFNIAGGVRGRDVTLRLDDILLLVVGMVWMTRTALTKQLGAIRVTPLNQSIFVYMAIYVVCTLVGVLRGTARWFESIFYLLKYLE